MNGQQCAGPQNRFTRHPSGMAMLCPDGRGSKGGVRIAGGLGFLCQDSTLPCCQATCLNFADTFRCGANHFARYSKTTILGRLLAQPLPIPISVVLLFRRNCSPPLAIVLRGARLEPALTLPYHSHGHKRRRGYCTVIDTMHCQGWVTRCMQHEVGNMIYGVGRCRGKSLKCLMLIQQQPHIAAYD